jgi:hypothetical protein
MDKVRSGTNSASMCIRWLVREPQIPPLRYAPVGMTIHLGNQAFTHPTAAASCVNELSSLPERTRISCFAALTKSHVCGFP